MKTRSLDSFSPGETDMSAYPDEQLVLERLHRTLNAELISRHSFPDLPACQVIFDDWRETYNLVRPHEALDMAVLAERYQPISRPFPDTLPPVLYDVSDWTIH